jgi:anti-sigma regulatory factor (Ser/Thr protein kinase)
VSFSASLARDRGHAHVAGVYDRDDELIPTVAAFLADALRPGGTAVVLATPTHRDALDAELVTAGFSIEDLHRAGQYWSFDARTTLAAFMRDDRPNRDAFESAIGSILETASARDTPVRIFGEMVGLLWDAGNIEGALDLESMWNDLAEHHAFALFCGYSMSSLEATGDLAAAKQMCDRHSNVLTLPDTSATVSPPSDSAPRNTYDRVFVGAPVALREVRRFVREVLGIWGVDDWLGNAEIIASELATNAVKHARSPFRVSMTRSRASIVLAVRDASFRQPQPRARHTDDDGGRGLALVSELSNKWGTNQELDGKTVWAELAHPAPVG